MEYYKHKKNHKKMHKLQSQKKDSRIHTKNTGDKKRHKGCAKSCNLLSYKTRVL